MRGLTYRVWRTEDFRKTAFKQLKHRNPMEVGSQDGKHALNLF